MSDNEKAPEFEPDMASDAGDVEILEVVGVDDDLPAPSASNGGEEDDDVVFTLDADVDTEIGEEGPEFEGLSGEEAAPEPESSLDDSEALSRLRADYDNLRKRVARERDDFQLQANSSLIEGLLPVMDNFDRALQVPVASGADGAFRAGMVMIYEQFNEALKSQGLRRIDTVGQPFDPTLHDAVATDAESSAPANTIVEEYQRGYLFQNRVLRPAMVKVSTNGTGVRSTHEQGEG